MSDIIVYGRRIEEDEAMSFFFNSCQEISSHILIFKMYYEKIKKKKKH